MFPFKNSLKKSRSIKNILTKQPYKHLVFNIWYTPIRYTIQNNPKKPLPMRGLSFISTTPKSIKHWITEFHPHQYLNTDRGTEHLNTEMAICCTLLAIGLSPGTLHAPRTNEIVEVQNKSFGIHLRMFQHDTPENKSIEVHFFASNHSTQPLLHRHVLPSQIFYHTQPRIALIFQ